MEEILQEAIQYHQSGNIQSAYDKYSEYTNLNSSNGHAFYLMGAAALHLKKTAEAVGMLSKAVQLNPSHPNSWCCLGHALKEVKDYEQASNSYKNALQLQPMYDEAAYHLGDSCELLEKSEEAIEAFRKCFEINPTFTDIALRLSNALANADRTEEAEKFLATYTPNDNDKFQLACLRGKIASDNNDLKSAEKFYREAMEINSDNADVHYNLGVIFLKQDQKGWALSALCTALKHSPEDSKILFMCGKAAMECQQFAAAVEHFENAIKHGLDNTEVYLKLGTSLRNTKEPRKAIVQLQKALIRDPKCVAAYCEIGTCLRAQKNYENSVKSYLKALDLEEKNVHALIGIAATYREYGGEHINQNMTNALKYAKLSIEADPENAGAHYNLGNVYMDLGMSQQAIDQHAVALGLDRANVSGTSTSLFNSNYLCDTTNTEIFEKHKSWGEEFMDAQEPESVDFKNPRDPDKKLKIGYVSPDFCVHPVAYFFKPIVNAHNKDNVELYLYSNNYSDRLDDEYSLFFKEKADSFKEIQKKQFPEIVDMIREDGIDILVDLAGHSCGHSLGAFALRAAPIQVSWIGYPNTTGMKAIDYRFTDNVLEPDELQKISTEKLYQLPNGFNCYAQPYPFPESKPPPALENGYVTFGSFNNSCKMNQHVIRLWSDILKRIPTAKLILKDKFLRLDPTIEFILSSFEKNGVSRDRIEILSFSPNNYMHMETYAKLDIALDPFPYNGTTTSCEALTMGVPIVTLLGDRHSARVTGSLVSRAGMSDWIAETEEEYINIAEEKASDIQALAKLREGQRQRVLDSSIYNAELIASDVENAYQDMWKRWCEEQNS